MKEDQYSIDRGQAQLKRCPICLIPSQMPQHLHECISIPQGSIQQKPTFFLIEGHGCLCRHCFNLFSNQDWSYHRKSQICRKQSRQPDQMSKSQKGKSLPERIPNHSIHPSHAIFASRAQRKDNIHAEDSVGLTQGSQLSKDLIRIAQSILAPLVKEWVNRHQQIAPNVLVVYLTSQIISFGTNFLNKKVVVPTWELIQKKGGQSINWKIFLELPQNLFNDVFIDSKLQKMISARKQLRTIRALNRLASFFPGLIKKRQPPKLTRNSRQKMYVCITEIIVMIKHLLQQRRRKIVHLALDLYLILICSQRYLSDRKRMMVGVLDLLQRNIGRRDDELIQTFSIQIGKTGVRQEVILNKQLVKLLQQFKWQGWHPKTERQVRRMREWLGITGYSFKSSILEAVTQFSSNLGAAQRMAAHRSQRNTQIYTPGTKFRDILRIVDMINIPNLHPRFGNYSSQQFKEIMEPLRIPHLRYQQFTENWIELLMPRLYGHNWRINKSQDEQINFMQTSMEAEILENNQQMLKSIPQEDRINQLRALLNGGKQDQEQIMPDIDQFIEDTAVRSILIFGTEVRFNKNTFTRDNFFDRFIGYEQLTCYGCSMIISSGDLRLKCVYCQADYHQLCPPPLCLCSKVSYSLQSPLILIDEIVAQLTNQVIVMPSNYMRNVLSSEEGKIEALMAARRYRYTRVAVVSPGNQIYYPNNYWRDLKKLELAEYQNYVTGRYFPPIEIKVIQEFEPHAVWGSEWGVFAVENIAVNVLIGQYACDIVQGRDLILCKKSDSIFRHSGGASPKDTFLAPINFSGWVLLINTAPKKECNCRPIRLILNNCVKIILVTSRPILKGDQLFYDYGTDYKFKKK